MNVDLRKMNYFFDCPYCSQSFEVEAELAGLNCVCTGCGEVFIVPAPPKDESEQSSFRLNDLDDMRPEVWAPEAADDADQQQSIEAEGRHDPLSPQYAGDALVGDRIVPLNFVPTGMETLSEVYGMTPDPEENVRPEVEKPAEVKVKRVTPMMVQSSEASKPDALRGIIRGLRKDELGDSGAPVRAVGGAAKYVVLGVSVGLLIGVLGMRAVKLLHEKPASPLLGVSESGIGGIQSPVEANDGSRPMSEGGSVANPFPDSFMGVKFGSKIEYITDRVTWAKEGENLHKPATLADERVEAVLVPDHEGRLTVGAYVRLSDLPDNELVPFLEWALTVQDAVTSKFGRPKSVHVVKNAGTENEIVRRIRSGDDFYECIWEDPISQCLITLSVVGKSSRLVVFRLEYKSIPLTRSYLDRKNPR